MLRYWARILLSVDVLLVVGLGAEARSLPRSELGRRQEAEFWGDAGSDVLNCFRSDATGATKVYCCYQGGSLGHKVCWSVKSEGQSATQECKVPGGGEWQCGKDEFCGEAHNSAPCMLAASKVPKKAGFQEMQGLPLVPKLAQFGAEPANTTTADKPEETKATATTTPPPDSTPTEQAKPDNKPDNKPATPEKKPDQPSNLQLPNANSLSNESNTEVVKDEPLSGGIIAAIVVPIIIALALAGALIFFCLRRRREKKRETLNNEFRGQSPEKVFGWLRGPVESGKESIASRPVTPTSYPNDLKPNFVTPGTTASELPSNRYSRGSMAAELPARRDSVAELDGGVVTLLDAPRSRPGSAVRGQ